VIEALHHAASTGLPGGGAIVGIIFAFILLRLILSNK
jgi:hypothetical protein